MRFIFLLCAALWCGTANAMDCEKLPPPIQARIFKCVHETMLVKNPTVTWEDLDWDAVALFLEGFNASPPESNAVFTDIRIYTKPGVGSYFLVFALGPRVVGMSAVPKEVVDTWRAGKAWRGESL